MIRLHTILTAAVLTIHCHAAPPRPNIVLIYGDDVGYGDVGCYGAEGVSTPHIDGLARDGLRFTNGYATSATCTPSRFSLFTGKYAFRQTGTGVLPGNAALIIRPGSATLPAVLRDAGYTTGAIGKWHLGLGSEAAPVDWNGEIRPGPLEIGFDYSYIMAATGDRVPCVYVENRKVVNLDHADPIRVSYTHNFPGEPTGITARDSLKMDWSHGHNDSVVNGVGRIGFMTGGKAALWNDETMAATFTGKAEEFIESAKDKPFFLYFGTHGIHVPRLPDKRFLGKSTMGPRGDAIAEFDWCVGEILNTLDRLGLAENTMVIVSSDNGPVLDDGYKDMANEKLGEHKPAGALRGGKYSIFEGGTRVPLVVRWPGKIEHGVSGALVSQVDFLATFAALTGGKIDADDAPDSQDMTAALVGKSEQGRESLVEYKGSGNESGLALRKGDLLYISPGVTREKLGPWKFVKTPAPGALFDLASDPGQTQNIAADQPEKVKEMRRELAGIVKKGK